MKKLMLVLLGAVAGLAVARAQGPELTTLWVDVEVTRQEIVAGPYARYAQKYLGISAPLADKVLLEVTGAKIMDFSGYDEPIRITEDGAGFEKLPVDRTSGIVPGAEESARLAAAKIFEIRRSRFELITGNAGENVFGAGLASALAELARLEEEHLALFLGKQTTTRTVRRFRVTPTRSTQEYVLCRFDDAEGLRGADEDGYPVMLELKVLGVPVVDGLGVTDKPTSRSTAWLVPADVQCRVVWDGEELASTTLPVKQLGKVVYVTQ